MNSAPAFEFSRLTRPSQDLRPQYEAALFDIVRTLWRRRFLMGGIIAFVVLTAVGATAMIDKTYVGEALIQLKFNGEGAGLAGATDGGSGASIDAAAIVEGEAEIIRSRAIARRVAAMLDARGGRLTESTEAGSPTSATGSAMDEDGDGGRASALSTAWALLDQSAQWLGLRLSAPPTPALDRSVMSLQDSLMVQNDGKSYLIRIGFAAHDPARAAAVANAFADAYLQSRIEVSVNSARRTSDWLATQVTAAKEAVATRERRAAEARRAGGGAASEIGDVLTTDRQLGDLVAQMSAARLDRLNLEARLQRLREASALGQTPSVADLAGSTDAQRLIEAEVTARQDASRLASTLGTKHPLSARASTSLDNARAQLASAVASAIGITERDVASAKSSELSLQRQIELAKRASMDAEAAAKSIRQLDADAASARTNLETVQENYRQALALADLKPLAAEMVSPAEPLSVPSSPKMSLTVILAGMGGVALSLVAVFALEQRDTGFKSASQIVAGLGARCFGTIPSAGLQDSPAAQRVREQAMRVLTINSGLTKHRGRNAIVVVTSAIPGEGKTELVRSLALTLAKCDRRVLTIENTGRAMPDALSSDGAMFDTGRSHKVALTTMEQGESGPKVSCYYRSTTDLQRVFEHHDGLQSWLEAKSAQFDIVIVEAPPILTDAEALVVTWAADLVLLTVRWNSTPKAAVAAAYAQICRSHNLETGVVLNEVDIDKHKRFGIRDGLYYCGRYLRSA